MITFKVNGQSANVDVDPSTPLLWVLRENLGLTGTKYGCGMAQCGACTVHINGQAARSCVAPVSRVAGKEVTTIEGLSSDLSHPLQWSGGIGEPGVPCAAPALANAIFAATGKPVRKLPMRIAG